MSRFYFHVDGRPDDLGVDLSDVAAAKCEAVRYAGNVICEGADRFCDSGDFSMSVTNESGLILFTLSLAGTDAPVIQSYPTIRA